VCSRGTCGTMGNAFPKSAERVTTTTTAGSRFALSITIQHTQEILCLSHIYAVAGMAGVNLSVSHVFDYGVDGQFTPVVARNGRLVNSGYPLDFQAKATINWELGDGNIIYDLEAKTYNDIVSRTAAETTLILILLCLPQTQNEWHGATCDETILRHCCYWHTFTGEVTDNSRSKRIFIPRSNLLTADSLTELLATERERRQGQVE